MTSLAHLVRGVILHADAAGYEARLVELYQCEWTGETLIARVIDVGPRCNAGLVARSRAIEWARQIRQPWLEDRSGLPPGASG